MIHWDPDPILFTVPYVHWPIFWYGVLFTLGFVLGFPLFISVLVRYFLIENPNLSHLTAKKRASSLTDQLTVYLVIATILGARLGHFLFYERPASYFKRPWEILQIWEGGLASHGAAVAIILALVLFSRRVRKTDPTLTWLRLLDFVVIPTALVGAFIRVGNFFNQEILGTPSKLPWAIIFGHPADRSCPLPRHPVQIYEALFYFGVFLLLWRLSLQRRFLMREGKLSGIFLILVFGFRFAIESLKEEQSHLIPGAFPLTMGQLLSIPAVLVGIFLYRKR